LAAEGLFYNNPKAACRILGELLEQASRSDREAKAKFVSELVASLEEPPDSPPASAIGE
jgi:hypothetical protein